MDNLLFSLKISLHSHSWLMIEKTILGLLTKVKLNGVEVLCRPDIETLSINNVPAEYVQLVRGITLGVVYSSCPIARSDVAVEVQTDRRQRSLAHHV